MRRLTLWQSFKAAAEEIFRPILSLGRRRRKNGSDSASPRPPDDEAKRHELARNADRARAERRRKTSTKIRRVTPKDGKGEAARPPRQSRARQPPRPKPTH